jgi:hypothetical protein
MLRWLKIRGGIGSAAIVSVLVALGMPTVAEAHSGEFAKFNGCPSTTTGVEKCLDAVTIGGEIVLGTKKTPIEHDVTLQGGMSEENENEAEGFPRKFFAASGAETLSKTPQTVPGGLLGIVPKESSPWLVKQLLKFFESGLLEVKATLELAKPASEIQVSEFNLLLESGTALKLPVKVHLENAFLGSSCYVGSSSSPIWWNLTTGTTAPSKPNEPIHGTPGSTEIKEHNEIAAQLNSELVENNWSAPAATGCGGILSFLVNPIIDSQIGLPSTAGHSAAILKNDIYVATATSVNNH